MEYLGLLIVIAVWFGVVALIYMLRAMGVKTPLRVYYGVFIMLRDEELTRTVIKPLGNALRRVPHWLMVLIVVGLFSISMFAMVPVPLSIMGINSWGIPSMLYLIVRNTEAVMAALTHKLTPIETVKRGFTPLAPLIPGVTISLLTFLYVIIAIGIGILLHELAHGAVASRYGVKIKSGGAFALLFLAFGGFVEIDEDEVRRMSLPVKLTIYSSGVFMNIVLAYLAATLVSLMTLNPYLTREFLGTTIVYVANTTDVVFKTGYVLTHIDGKPITSIYGLIPILSSANSSVTLTLYNPVSGQVVNVVESTRNLTMSLLGYSALYISPWGIVVEDRSFYNLMFWIYTLNLTLALLNALPAYPLDGGQFLDSLLARVIRNDNTRFRVMTAISAILWSLIVLTIYYTVSTGLYKLL
ncbi:site-2 protease family protein [Vulcanisaeta thermophila]|uniref:site-2 protease family protein n=1 Tax=Vulcanisaeta thermophila TaxID=867917 RepID=UPI0008532DD8|nr:site-2 protease family protein [Vulcanisaeta thermophila]